MNSSSQNILFIIVDQLRADCLNGALSHFLDMPHLRALQQEAVSFTNHFSVLSPCGPSRASIMTGLYGMNHRSIRNGTPLSQGITNIAKEMRKASYEPMLLGYNDHSHDPRYTDPQDPRLKSYEMPLSDFVEKLEMRFGKSRPWQFYLKSKGYAYSDYKDYYISEPTVDEQTRINEPAFYKKEDSDTAFMTNELIKTLSMYEGESWFVNVNYVRPHPPFIAPAPYHNLYDPKKLPLPKRCVHIEEEIAIHPYFENLKELGQQDLDFYGAKRARRGIDNDEDMQALRAVYLGLTTELDHHIGRIIAYLKESGQYDNTLLIFTSDHGEMLGERYSLGKMTVYNGAFHTSLIIRDPFSAQTHGTFVDAFSESIDIMPTILDWVGLDVPSAVNGVSVMPFLKGENPENWRDHSYSEVDFGDPENPTMWQKHLGLSLRESNIAMIREKRFQLAHFNGGLDPLLFDMQSAEGELKNLAKDPAHSDQLLRLTQKLLNHRMRHADHTLSDMKIGNEQGAGR